MTNLCRLTVEAKRYCLIIWNWSFFSEWALLFPDVFCGLLYKWTWNKLNINKNSIWHVRLSHHCVIIQKNKKQQLWLSFCSPLLMSSTSLVSVSCYISSFSKKCQLTYTYTPLFSSCRQATDMTDGSDTANQLQLSKVTHCYSALIGWSTLKRRPCLL